MKGKKEWLLAIFISISLLLSNVSIAQNDVSFEDIFGSIFLGKIIITPECSKITRGEPGPTGGCDKNEYEVAPGKCCPLGTRWDGENCLREEPGPQQICPSPKTERLSDGSCQCPNLRGNQDACASEGGIYDTENCVCKPKPSSPQQCPSGQVRDINTGECRRTEPAPQPQISCQEFASYNQGTNFGNKASIYECRDTAKASMPLQSSGLCGREVQPQLFAYFDTASGCCSGVWSPSYNPIQYPETFCGYYRNTDWTAVSFRPVEIHTRTWFAKNRDEYETCAEINSKRSVPLETC